MVTDVSSLSWVGRNEDGWKFSLFSFYDLRTGRFRSHTDAHICNSVVGNRFSCECRFFRFEEIELPNFRLDIPISKVYRTASYLINVPAGVNLCRNCFCIHSWRLAVERLGISEETITHGLTVTTVADYRALSNRKLQPINEYIKALKIIYFKSFGLDGGICTLKTLDKTAFLRDRVNFLIEEFLSLGIIKLIPVEGSQVIRVRYNEDVEIDTALEVLMWYGKQSTIGGC